MPVYHRTSSLIKNQHTLMKQQKLQARHQAASSQQQHPTVPFGVIEEDAQVSHLHADAAATALIHNELDAAVVRMKNPHERNPANVPANDTAMDKLRIAWSIIWLFL